VLEISLAQERGHIRDVRVSVTMGVLCDFASGYIMSTVEKTPKWWLCTAASLDDCLFDFEDEIEYADIF
jgi:hypothetical protein